MRLKIILALIIGTLVLGGCSDAKRSNVKLPGLDVSKADEGSQDSSKEDIEEQNDQTVDESNRDSDENVKDQNDNIQQYESDKPINNENHQNDSVNEGSEEISIEGEYIGQALNTIEKNGITKIYEEKDTNSKVIYKMKDLEKVELVETLPYGWFKVKLKDGSFGYADARYIRSKEIPPHEYNENVDGYALIFNQDDQLLKIYKDGELVSEAKGSAGLWDNFTPKGVFEIEKGRRGEWFYVKRFEQGMKYWVGFKGTYLFHSLPFTEDKQLIQEEADKLGQPASHGCIRLPVDVAKYIYDNVPVGSLVIIN